MKAVRVKRHSRRTSVGGDIEVPSLLTRWHSTALARLPGGLRALAARMFRRMVRSRGFLARFILDDPDARRDIDDDAADDDRTSLVHRGYQTPTAVGESARERFDAYLETLQKAVGLKEQIAAYDDASRNRDIVTRVTGSVASSERDRLFTGFNTPLVPEVLIVTTVGQEGIDLHRECRHVIHHDLPWNPATLEQRTGRVDRIGSKTERIRGEATKTATSMSRCLTSQAPMTSTGSASCTVALMCSRSRSGASTR